jgi:hypothetical protein
MFDSSRHHVSPLIFSGLFVLVPISVPLFPVTLSFHFGTVFEGIHAATNQNCYEKVVIHGSYRLPGCVLLL